MELTGIGKSRKRRKKMVRKGEPVFGFKFLVLSLKLCASHRVIKSRYAATDTDHRSQTQQSTQNPKLKTQN